jgi:hypothetical protein
VKPRRKGTTPLKGTPLDDDGAIAFAPGVRRAQNVKIEGAFDHPQMNAVMGVPMTIEFPDGTKFRGRFLVEEVTK